MGLAPSSGQLTDIVLSANEEVLGVSDRSRSREDKSSLTRSPNAELTVPGHETACC